LREAIKVDRGDFSAMVHDKGEFIYLATWITIAVVSGALAGWLSITARVKAALAGASHARAQMLSANAQLQEALRDMVSLRRQLAHVIAENEELQGRLFLAPDRGESTEWELSQSLLDSAADKIDESASSVLAQAPPIEHKPIQMDNGKLIFRKGPIELDASDFASDPPSS
jgi:hypothetical protein